jgi:hypothetical protein
MSVGNSNLAETKALLLEMVAEAQELKQAAGGSVADAVAGWLGSQYLVAAREKLTATGGAGRFEVLRTFVQDWAKLRHGDHTAERLQIEREKLAAARKDDQCKALEICLEETRKWPDVEKLFRAAFVQFAERKKGKP